MKKTLTIAATLFASASLTNAATLFTSNFDANTGAFVFAGDTDNTSGSSSLNVTWTTPDPAVSSISGLTVISSTDGGTTTQGGFAQTQNGAGVFANPDVVYISRNHNLANPRTNAQLGYSFTFTLDSAFNLDTLNVRSTHTNNSGNSDQVFTSDLLVNISDTSGSVFGQTITQDYSDPDGYKNVDFTVSGTTLDAGTYTFSVVQSNMVGTGAYASYDGITLEGTAVPEPSSTALLGLGGLALILRRRR